MSQAVSGGRVSWLDLWRHGPHVRAVEWLPGSSTVELQSRRWAWPWWVAHGIVDRNRPDEVSQAVAVIVGGVWRDFGQPGRGAGV